MLAVAGGVIIAVLFFVFLPAILELVGVVLRYSLFAAAWIAVVLLIAWLSH